MLICSYFGKVLSDSSRRFFVMFVVFFGVTLGSFLMSQGILGLDLEASNKSYQDRVGGNLKTSNSEGGL